jgi:hypothetical protein
VTPLNGSIPSHAIIEPSISGAYRIAADQPRDVSTGTRPVAVLRSTAPNDSIAVRIQPVDATIWLNISAGV